MPVIELTSEQVDAWRMARHYLTTRAPQDQLLDVASQIGCLHAQMMSAAELSAGARVDGITATTVQNALWNEHSLVKTWAMRGTLHLVPAQDYPVYVAALSTRRNYEREVWLRAFKITLPELEAIINGVREALDGRCLTREQLADEVGRVTGSEYIRDRLRSGWGEFLKPAAFRGYLCFGPSQGQSVTFVRPDQWIGEWQNVDSQAALHTLVRRYISAYGPATHEDFAHWFGTDPAPARRLFKDLAGELQEVSVEGKKAWALASEVDDLSRTTTTNTVRLLPNFDPYTVAVRDHRQYLGEHKDRVYRQAGWISPVVLVNGRITGVWKYEKARSGLSVTVEMFEPHDANVEEQIEAEAKRIGDFLGAVAEITFGSV